MREVGRVGGGIHDLAASENTGTLCADRLQLDRAGLHRDGFAYRAELQNNRRQPDAVMRKELDLVLDVSLESLRLHGERICRRGQRGDGEGAFGARRQPAENGALSHVCQFHLRVGNDGSLAVLNDAADGTERLLPVCRRTVQKQSANNQAQSGLVPRKPKGKDSSEIAHGTASQATSLNGAWADYPPQFVFGTNLFASSHPPLVALQQPVAILDYIST